MTENIFQKTLNKVNNNQVEYDEFVDQICTENNLAPSSGWIKWGDRDPPPIPSLEAICNSNEKCECFGLLTDKNGYRWVYTQNSGENVKLKQFKDNRKKTLTTYKKRDTK